MSHEAYARQILAVLDAGPDTIPAIETDERRQNNAARCMTQLLCNRLSHQGVVPTRFKRSTYQWMNGLITFRNCRIANHHWSTLQVQAADELHREAETQPVVFLLTCWMLAERRLHVWVIPEDVAHLAFAELPVNQNGPNKTISLFPGTQQLRNAPNAPDLSTYYLELELLDEEADKLVESIKLDDAMKQTEDADDEESEEHDELGDESAPYFTEETVRFVKELAEHTQDREWHTEQKQRYEQVLRDPVRAFFDAVRDRYVARLDAEVAGGKRKLSLLKKNDFGQGGYHDHYWCAFYDPDAGSKTKSVQLYFRMLGSEQIWRYGLSLGHYCDAYLTRLESAIHLNRILVAEHLRVAPQGTRVRLGEGEATKDLSPQEFAEMLGSSQSEDASLAGELEGILIMHEEALDVLPDRDAGLVDEVGEFFMWAWPFFAASITGNWPLDSPVQVTDLIEVKSDEDVDEDVPTSIAELSERTALSPDLLEELRQSLLARQQTVLVGPPGTSKTYIARQFARYFVRQRNRRAQGCHDILYLHANWNYEDFFEGIKPTTTDAGTLTFQPQKGFLLQWIEQLKSFDPSCRHVLILDEINRCDTAAVLGELLQLLEHRGSTVRLLSGRSFVFPRNLYIIGTMNSADRSIGRMDLALRRRFFWLDLHSDPDTLQRWLNRVGNNPVGFQASSLVACNELLTQSGIGRDQNIGHALFMPYSSETDDEIGATKDMPLTEDRLRQIVRFSVVPYVRELLVAQQGQVNEDLVSRIHTRLLSCMPAAETPPPAEDANQDG